MHRTLPGSADGVPAGVDLMGVHAPHVVQGSDRAYGGHRRANVRVALPWVGPQNARSILRGYRGSQLGSNESVLRPEHLTLLTTMRDPEWLKGVHRTSL